MLVDDDYDGSDLYRVDYYVAFYSMYPYDDYDGSNLDLDEYLNCFQCFFFQGITNPADVGTDITGPKRKTPEDAFAPGNPKRCKKIIDLTSNKPPVVGLRRPVTRNYRTPVAVGNVAKQPVVRAAVVAKPLAASKPPPSTTRPPWKPSTRASRSSAAESSASKPPLHPPSTRKPFTRASRSSNHESSAAVVTSAKKKPQNLTWKAGGR